jgi:hypothetical protein
MVAWIPAVNQGWKTHCTLHLISLIFLSLLYEHLLSRLARGQFRTLDSLSLEQVIHGLRPFLLLLGSAASHAPFVLIVRAGVVWSGVGTLAVALEGRNVSGRETPPPPSLAQAL